LIGQPHSLSQSALERAVNERDGLANVILLFHPLLHQLASVQHRAMIAAAERVANFIERCLG